MGLAMKLSLIMPCYNVEKTLGRALDSILRQRVNFSYEVLIINDGSTDKTKAIAEYYCKNHPQVRLIDNAENQGNARTFKRGLESARGEYFAVLDGDDFYTVRDKLQKQVDFLDSDTRGEYGAVAHKYIAVYPDGAIRENLGLFYPASDFSYCDFLNQKFYYHTATIMYRNYFRGLNIPILKTQRGDTIRTLISLNASYGKMKVLDFIGSAYFLNPAGIWSSLDREKRKQINLDAWNSGQSYVESAREKMALEFAKGMIMRQPTPPEENIWTPDQILQIVKDEFANPLAFFDKDFIFRKLYKSEVADSLCESVGYIQYALLGFSPNPAPDNKKAAVLISALNRTGGGIYREIMEMCEIMRTREIHLIVTDMKEEDIDPQTREELASFSNVRPIFMGGVEDHLAVLEAYLHKINPGRIYYYCGHNNTLVDAAMQDYGAKNIVPFSFDHGLSLGLDNTNIDMIIAKTPKDYKLLAKKFADRAIYIPCWNKAVQDVPPYEPFADGQLATATAAARFYKYEGDILGKFADFITNIMKVTGGGHIHYGPLPARVKAEILKSMSAKRLPESRFKHIEWADNLAGSMLQHRIGLFISPFPIGSIKLNLQCEAAGIPMLVYDGGLTRIEKNDFLHPDVLKWKNRKEFYGILRSLNKDALLDLSAKGQKWFKTHNELGMLMPYMMFDRCFDSVPIPPPHVDTDIIDVRNVQDLLLLDLRGSGGDAAEPERASAAKDSGD